MKTRTFNKRLLKYEIRNLMGNCYVFIFGIFFPILLLLLISKAAAAESPESLLSVVNTAIFLTISPVIPMSVVLLGYSANYSQELEKEIPLRMELFGYSFGSILTAKILAHFGVMTVGLILYAAIGFAALELQIPSFSSALCLIVCLYLLGTIFFALAHGVATIFKKFGPTYVLMMLLYFGTMLLCGMMGIQTDLLPSPAQSLAALLPMSYICQDFIDFWSEGSYNFVPLIQSYLFFGALAGILLVLAYQKERRS